jgi:hypothetical protein
MPAAITAAMGPKALPARPAMAKAKAALLTGPPMSKAIMQPRMMPSRIEFAP